jgi:MFS family permease
LEQRAVFVALASLIALALATGGHYVAVVGMIPITDSMNWPRSVPATAYSLAILGMGVGGIYMGRWSDRVGVAIPVAAGACSIALGAYWSAHAQSSWELLVANGVLIGLCGNAAFFVPLMANVTRWFTVHRGIAVGIVSAGQSLGGAVWPPVHRLLIEQSGWRSTYVTFAILMLCCAFPLAWMLRHRPPAPVRHATAARSGPDVPSSIAPTLNVSKRTLHVTLCLAIVGCCVAMSMPMVHVIAHASDLGHSVARAAEILSVLLLASFVSRLLWGALSDRIGGLSTLALSSICQAVMLVAFLVVDSLMGLYVVAALYGLAYGGIVPTYSVIVREHFPTSELGWRIGVVYLFGTVGMATGGVLGGVIFDWVGNYVAAFSVGLAFNVANLVLILPLVMKERVVGRMAQAH